MSRIEARDLALLVIQAEDRPSLRASLLYALYVLHRVYLTWVLVGEQTEAERDTWSELARMHAA